jgi:hypothetical protein
MDTSSSRPYTPYTVQGARHGMGQWEENTGELDYKQKVVNWLKQTLD